MKGSDRIQSFGTMTQVHSTVRNNTPDNCAPPGSVPGCIG
jgi:hypothetical protein